MHPITANQICDGHGHMPFRSNAIWYLGTRIEFIDSHWQCFTWQYLNQRVIKTSKAKFRDLLSAASDTAPSVPVYCVGFMSLLYRLGTSKISILSNDNKRILVRSFPTIFAALAISYWNILNVVLRNKWRRCTNAEHGPAWNVSRS